MGYAALDTTYACCECPSKRIAMALLAEVTLSPPWVRLAVGRAKAGPTLHLIPRFSLAVGRDEL